MRLLVVSIVLEVIQVAGAIAAITVIRRIDARMRLRQRRLAALVAAQ